MLQDIKWALEAGKEDQEKEGDEQRDERMFYSTSMIVEESEEEGKCLRISR